MNKLVFIIFTVIITLLMVFLFAFPAWRQARDLNHALILRQAEYDGQSVYYAHTAELVKSIEEKNSALEKIHSALPDNAPLAPLVYFFQNKSKDAGLAITSLELSNISADSSYGFKNITFVMDLTGTYQGLKTLLSLLETSARLFEVNSIALTTIKTSKNPQQTYNFKLEVVTHSY